jgi:hypothetical protein
MRSVVIGFAFAFLALGSGRDATSLFDERRALDWDHKAIRYSEWRADDPVARLQKRIEEGAVNLNYESQHGYLRSLLQALQVPVSSQILVFSKTSFQAARISPRTPRALYFNDEVSVGWVRGGDVLEIVSIDPHQGPMFYTIDQEPVGRPRLVRRDECLQCHAGVGTSGVPGLVVRSVHVERSGMVVLPAESFITDHRSPLKERWGGWYVTGTHGSQTHMGNAVIDSAGRSLTSAFGNSNLNLSDLKYRFDTGAYLSPFSDIVALMTVEHQTRMTNLITRLGYDTRIADAEGRPPDNGVLEELVKYMLFADEALLEAPVRGVTDFTEEFARRGPRDRKGRSLRDFDLTKRLMRYPCSFLIYSESFDGLPEAARERVYRRLWEVLSGQDTSPTFARMTEADRRAVKEILIDTKPGLPEYWTNEELRTKRSTIRVQ